MTITDIQPRIEAREGVAVTLYSKPKGCVQCDATKRKFLKEGIEYTEVDVTTDETALAYIKSLGYSQAPVVFTSGPNGDHHWSGYNVTDINTHILGKAAA